MYEKTRHQLYYFLNMFLENGGTTEKVPFSGKKLVYNQDEEQWLDAEKILHSRLGQVTRSVARPSGAPRTKSNDGPTINFIVWQSCNFLGCLTIHVLNCAPATMQPYITFMYAKVLHGLAGNCSESHLPFWANSESSKKQPSQELSLSPELGITALSFEIF